VGLLGLPRLRSASYVEGHLPANDPELLRFERLEGEFGSDRVALFAFGCGERRACRDVFEPEVLALVGEMTRRVAEDRAVVEAVSLTTVAVLTGEAGDLRALRLGWPGEVASVARFKELVGQDPVLSRTLVSKDLRATALLARFEADLPDAERNRSALSMLADLRALAKKEGFELFATGDVLFAAVSDEYVQGDLTRLTPLMIALIAGILLWIFRELTSVLLALVTVALPTIWAFGAMGWTGRPITPVVSTLPILILVVGLTDALHFLVRVHDLRRSRTNLRDVVLEVAQEVGRPTTVTAVTSSLGFLSFLAGPIPALREFGVFAAIGILGAWLLTFTWIPLALTRFGIRSPLRTAPAFALGDRLLAGIHAMAHRRAPLILAFALVATGLSAYGVSRLTVENDGFGLLGEDDPLSISDRFLRTHLRGAGSVEIVYAPAPPRRLEAPEELRRLEEVERWFGPREGFGPVVSILPVLRVANREVGDARFGLPNTRGAAAQLLLLAETADPEAVRRLVTPDHALARLSIDFRERDLRVVRDTIEQLRQSLGQIFDGAGEWFLSGTLPLSLHIGDLVLESQVASFSTAFATIFAVLFFFVRSLPLGALGMVPNVLPVVGILGFMGLAGIHLDVATAMIASIVLGVSVDDTVYFLTHYQRARRGGATVRDATAYTFSLAGKPAVFGATLLALGFFVLGLSSFQSLALFGLLSGVAVLGAVLTEVVLLPSLLEVLRGRRSSA
jgi:predicted RND superfamily exporter protein